MSNLFEDPLVSELQRDAASQSFEDEKHHSYGAEDHVESEGVPVYDVYVPPFIRPL